MPRSENISYFALVLCLFYGAGVAAQPRRIPQHQQAATRTVQRQGQGQASAGLSEDCRVCMNVFSPQTLTFTANSARCVRVMPTCGGRGAGVCESMINDCFAFNCGPEGACTDEMANRALFFGCLKAEGTILPFTCASYIKGMAGSFAAMKRADMEESRRLHERNMQQAQLRSQEQQAATAAEADRARTQAEAQAAQAQLAFDQQRHRQDQDARDAEIRRQREAEQARQNARPHVMLNNTISEVRRALGTARTTTSSLITMMGVQRTETALAGNMLHTAPPTIEVQGFAHHLGTDARTRSFVNASMYGRGGIFRCTRDIRENIARAELENALRTLTQARNNLAQAISNLEMVNNDPDTIGSIGPERINSLFEIQNTITAAITQIQTSITHLSTSCETRCNGMSTLLTEPTGGGGGGISFDEFGNLIEAQPATGPGTAAGGWVCREMETTPDFDPMMFLGRPGSINIEAMMGGVSSRVQELTERVLSAVVLADRAVEMAEITLNIGRAIEPYDDEDDFWTGPGRGGNLRGIDRCAAEQAGSMDSLVNCIADEIQPVIESLRNARRMNETQCNNMRDMINSGLQTIARFETAFGITPRVDRNLICATGSSVSIPGCDMATVVTADRCLEGIRHRAQGSPGGRGPGHGWNDDWDIRDIECRNGQLYERDEHDRRRSSRTGNRCECNANSLTIHVMDQGGWIETSHPCTPPQRGGAT